jgi:hypothetical protein
MTSSRRCDLAPGIFVCLLVAVLVVLAVGCTPADSPTPNDNPTDPVSEQASGTFEVQLAPASVEEGVGDASIGRMSINKQFSGDLEGSSKGQMLSAFGDVAGSAGYVAIERVTGTLDGRSGSFTLKHNGTMTRGVPDLVIDVVPDSGTDELAGLAGTMSINIVDGRHFYELRYTLDSP